MAKTTTKTLMISTTLAVSVLGSAVHAATQWNVSLWGQRRAFTEHVEKLAELVEQKTNGEFTLNLSYGGLSNNRENLDGISFGAFEMAQFCAGYHPAKNPSITVLELPFLGVNSLEKEIEVSMAVYNHPAVKKDLARWNAVLLMPSPLPQYNVAGVGDAPSSLEDFKGLRVRATGGIGAAMETVGAVPTSMSATEVRQSIDSGVISAASFAPHAHMSFGTVEAADWWTTNLNPGTVNCPVVANSDALNSLSDEHRNALLDSIDEALEYYVEYYNNQTMSKWWPTLEERNIQQVTFSEQELQRFRNSVAEPAANAWIQEMNEQGLPAEELYQLTIDTIAD
ncbi:C4-dicarboxylate TRAP transporter substrate-binding protein [Reinekea blandensis]|uniref:TRAP dicarboxylate transporter, DctP subunit n=1 Tax=Reinekea blandensis MED297 TaxID=314283 RepID=A4B9M8_9GAMM|nr:C4-dicarboxylate TRAP transporter substrate-binding protein [Reinekea blandensis]EAR11329.1 TRAP dicarboxylate transporter, DctP subunit [Reinekea sp. MED297] [Reinekea blandensis MED297]